MRETVDAFAHGLASRPGQFEVVLNGPGPFVRADPAALEQVVANLLDNAVKYSRADQPIAVRVRAERLTAVVEVIDRGVGIALSDHGTDLRALLPRARARATARASASGCRSSAS